MIEIDNCAEVNKEGECLMCNKGILISKDKKCLKENKCELPNCDFCTRDENDNERCAMCDDDYSIKLVDKKTVCIEEVSEETEDCHY